RVVVTDVDEGRAQAVAREITDGGGSAVARELDARSPSHWGAVVHECEELFSRLDVAILNAGRNEQGRLEDLTDEGWSAQLRPSLDSVFYGARAALPLLQRGDASSIVVTSSIHGVLGFAGFPAYAAAK